MPAKIEDIRESPGHLRHKFKRSFMADLFESSLLPYCHLVATSDFEDKQRTHRGGSEDPKRRQRGKFEAKVTSVTRFGGVRHKNSKTPSHF